MYLQYMYSIVHTICYTGSRSTQNQLILDYTFCQVYIIQVCEFQAQSVKHCPEEVITTSKYLPYPPSRYDIKNRLWHIGHLCSHLFACRKMPASKLSNLLQVSPRLQVRKNRHVFAPFIFLELIVHLSRYLFVHFSKCFPGFFLIYPCICFD